jgi:DUF438 domain-containing protein
VSQIINNREYRQKVLKEIIMDLHNGMSVDDVRERFRELIKDVGPTEISEMEQGLIKEGLPPENIKKLCDVHVSVFKESLDKIKHAEEIPGHPVYTFSKENREVEKVMEERMRPLLGRLKPAGMEEVRGLKLELREGLNLLMDLDKHYLRKENLLFPYLEKYEVTGPPTVMWGIDDDIRGKLKEVNSILKEEGENESQKERLEESLEDALRMIGDMIYKEENILFPMCLETLTEEEWKHIMEQSGEIGYCLIEPEKEWKPNEVPEDEKLKQERAASPGGNIKFDTGILTMDELEGIFSHLPLDITFVDKDDVVKYFTPGKDRIFTRTKTIIGRKVQYCHPPASVHVVEKIIDDFKSGAASEAGFWIQMGDMLVYIRYIAVRDSKGSYMGTMEITMDAAPIKKLEGEKRLLSYETGPRM